jgi:hypothetical protein
MRGRKESLAAGSVAIQADFVAPPDPAGWVVVGHRPEHGKGTGTPGPRLSRTIARLAHANLGTMVLSLPAADVRTLAGWVHIGVSHLRDEIPDDLPVAYLGAGDTAAPGLIAAAGGAFDGVMAWNAQPFGAWGYLPAVTVPSLFVADGAQALLAAHAARWQLGTRPDIVSHTGSDDLSIVTRWYLDRLLGSPVVPFRPEKAGARRRLATIGAAAAVAAAPAGAFASAVAARPAVAATVSIPDFSAGNKLAGTQIGGDDAIRASVVSSTPAGGNVLFSTDIAGDGKGTGPIGDPPLLDGIGVQWNINTNVGFATSSSASGAVSEAGWLPGNPVAATTLNGGTVNQTLGDALDGYNGLCLDLNNVGGQCNTANMAVYNQNGPSILECSGRQVVLPLRTMGGLSVRRKVFVPTNDGFARWLNIVNNPTAGNITVRMQTSNNLGSDAGTRIVTTSDGDTTPELTDTWVTTFQNFSGTTSSDPRLGHVLRGPGAPVGLAAANFVNGDDNPFWRYVFTLAPGQTAIVMNFATAQATRAAAATQAGTLASLTNPNALACMTATERQQVVNFVAGTASTITTQASAGGTLGTSVTDTATLANFNSPTGTVTFNLYGPNDATCSGAAVFTDVKPVDAGNNNYTSSSFIPTADGTYRWTAAYSGDGINSPATSPCNAPNESVVIATPAPTITTQASAGGPVGTALTDTATLTGGASPTGNVTFRLYGPDNATCAAAPVFTSTNNLVGTTATSGSFAPTAPGVYRWTAVYNGDANNATATSPCNAPNESATIVKASPTIGTQASAGGPLGTSVTDTATLSGGASPSGTVTFRLFSDNTCTTQVFTSTNALTGGTATSGSFQPAAPGTYYWTATYNGDASNNAVSAPCNAPNETVTITKATPTISTQASPGGMVGVSLTDTATVSGGASPTGTVTFRLFSDNACTTQVFTSTNALAGATATSGSFTPAGPGTFHWTATYNGDANNNTVSAPCNAPNESAVVTPFAPPAPTSTLTGNVAGPVTVNAGESVHVTNARVTGPITVNPGGALVLTNSQVTNGVVATSPSFLSICGSQISAPSGNLAQGVVVSGATVPIRIGDPANGCATNRVAGDVSLTGNTGGLTFGSNIVSRHVTVNNNAGAVVIKGNTVFQTLACSGNNPAPTNAGQTNAAASKTGQCSGL